MQRRIFIIIGVVLAIVVAGAMIYVFTQGEGGLPLGDSQPEVPLEEQTATPIPMVDVIVARQPIPRGGEFLREAMEIKPFPEENVPPDAIATMEETFGMVAAVEIGQGLPILRTHLREKAAGPSGVAVFDIPAGHVMVAFPINKQTSVAYALEAGDVVDVLMTFRVIDIDADFQTILPNKFSFLFEEKSGEDNVRVELSPTLDEGRLSIEIDRFPGVEFPRENQRPRRVAQLTVQGAKVIRLGPWKEFQTQGGNQGQQQVDEEGNPIPPPPAAPDVVSLAVTPQDALVLLWARQTEVYMELALRAAGDEVAIHNTESVTLQYMLTRFNIAIPPKIEFAIDRSEDAVRPAEPQPAQPGVDG